MCHVAAQVCQAYFASDYAAFTALYVDAPRMTPYLMDALAGRVRRRGALAMVAAYASLPLQFISSQLGLDSVEKVGHGIAAPNRTHM